MPTNVWGYSVAEAVEVCVDGGWVMAVVVGFTRQRTVVVRPHDSFGSTALTARGFGLEIPSPNQIRLWVPPQTPDQIEDYLHG
jgi:hypothetical protein